MNGRCQKDALDRAEDICELCSNQYCAHCLLFPRGHRNPPTCKTCALESSGIRGGSTKRSAISRREYKKLKKELIAQLEEVEEKKPAIEYFELNDPSKFDRSNELDRRPAPAIAEEPTIDILNTGADATPAPAQAAPPAPHPAPHETTPPPPASTPPAAQPAFAETPETTAEAFAPVDTSINPLELNWSERRAAAAAPAEAAAPPPSEASASAAELLARLKADQPIQSQFHSAPAELDIDPFASPSPTPAPASEPVPAAFAPAAPTPTAPAPSTWSPPTPPPRGTNLAAKLAETEAAQGPPASRSGASFPAAAFPESPTQASPFADAPQASAPVAPAPLTPVPAPAPAAHEPIQASPFHDAPIIPEPVAPAPVAHAPREASPFGNGVNARPSQAAPPVERRAMHPEDEGPQGQPERRNADTDETGQWIPPSLRGMSATDERDPLPKRRN